MQRSEQYVRRLSFIMAHDCLNTGLSLIQKLSVSARLGDKQALKIYLSPASSAGATYIVVERHAQHLHELWVLELRSS